MTACTLFCAPLQPVFHLDLPWLATRSTVISVNSSIKCAAGCLKCVLSGATKEMFQEINDVELWDNKCYTFTWVQLWLRRDSSLHHKARKTQDPRGSLDELPYILIIDLRCTNFETFSFCLIAKVLAASQSIQLLQMLSCDSQIPLYLLKAPETVLTAPTDVSWATCAYLTQGTEIENTKFLRMIKKRVYLSVILVALFMLENYRKFPELHPVRCSSGIPNDWINKHHSTV